MKYPEFDPYKDYEGKWGIPSHTPGLGWTIAIAFIVISAVALIAPFLDTQHPLIIIKELKE